MIACLDEEKFLVFLVPKKKMNSMRYISSCNFNICGQKYLNRKEFLAFTNLLEFHFKFIFQFVHHHLQAAGEKITEMTPAAIYEIFIDLCRARLHLVIACTLGEQFSYSEIFRKHTSILSGSVQINFRVNSIFK